MNPLIKILEKLRTEPFEIGTYEGELYPVKVGLDKKKTFIYGKGYVSLKKKHMVEPLVIKDNLVKDILEYLEKYSSAVLLYAIGRESTQDCVNYSAINQLKSLVNHPEGWLEYFDGVHAINEKIKEIINEKWGVVIRGEWMERDCNRSSTGLSTSSFRSVLEFHPTVSWMGMISMSPHIDWIEYEKIIDRFIISFTPKGFYENLDQLLEIKDKLDNESVSSKLEYIAGKEVINMVNILEAKARGENFDPAQLEIEFKETGQ